ncbi:hypothetical protein [Modestobacter italicus]|uniref:hypothetical protein n=1 Tax=Modestobacter italicus (strain DSM 44449 / CECT 9708 / BC 501) TaxID=2732864 RepID=UPI001C98CE27|nr:hypothetical protein [Modestobacter italicus]
MTRNRSAEEQATIARGEAELRSWDRRRRLLIEAAVLTGAALYAFLVLGGGDASAAVSWGFLLLAVLLRAAVWRWGDRGARTDGARVDFALRHHRLAGWARPDAVRARAEQRVHRAGLHRACWSTVAVVFAAVTVMTLVADPPSPGLAVFGAVGVVGCGVLLWLHQRGLAEARRWLADPPV